MTPLEVHSPAEGVLSGLWSVLNAALCGASFDGSWTIAFVLGLHLHSL